MLLFSRMISSSESSLLESLESLSLGSVFVYHYVASLFSLFPDVVSLTFILLVVALLFVMY